jgi:tetratricopeptide (TPR) repeat protein
MIWERHGDDRRALDHALAALDRIRSVGDGASEAEALNTVARYAARLGHFDQAREHCATAWELHRYHPNRSGEADTLDNLAYIAQHTGDYTKALQLYEELLQLRRDLHDGYQEANTLLGIGETLVRLGNYGTARAWWTRARELFVSQGRTNEADHVSQQLDDIWHIAPGDAWGDAEDITIYTSGDDGTDVRDAVVDLLLVAGFDVVSREQPERGSWFQRLLVRQKEPRAREALNESVIAAVSNRMAAHVNGVAMQARDISLQVSTPAHSNDEGVAYAAARLIEASESHAEIVVCTNSMIFIKAGGRVVCWVPTADDIRTVRSNPQLSRSATDLLNMFDRSAPGVDSKSETNSA